MSIYFHRYVLRSESSLNSQSSRVEHEGALINVDGGYGCLHSWPELGDPPLDVLLDDLHSENTRIVQRSMLCAMLDREARMDGCSLFEGMEIPRSHATVSSADSKWIEKAVELGFDYIKLKGGRDLEKERFFLLEMHQAYPELRWRLDFNHRCSYEQSRLWYESLSDSLRHVIDFIEDAFFQDETPDDHWIAVDREIERWNEPLETAIIKPAVNAASVFLSRDAFAKHYVYTSYMDHPFGQVFAAYEAARAKEALGERLSVCGLVTHHLWEKDEFTEALGEWSPKLISPEGNGLGFGKLLESLPWKRL